MISALKRPWFWVFAIAAAALLAIGLMLITDDGATGSGGTVAVSGDAGAVAAARGLTPDDVLAAVKTYTPSGMYDEYVSFLSGGHSGQVLAVGVPSMRILKTIAVFTPEPWQGYGYGGAGSKEVLEGGETAEQNLSWGDAHHPALSETGGDYDGQWLFINDKANARIAVIDLRDFETKQIVKNPVTINDHGGPFVTPDTEWVIQGGQYAAPLGWDYAALEQYQTDYRGTVTFWKFDREQGRIDPARSFALELPPYWQDLCDSGKLVSESWVVCNSFNTEMALGGVEEGEPPFETGASQNDMDYLHIIDLEKAVGLVDAGRTETVEGFEVLTLETAVAEGVLWFAPEPKSPHGVDVTPGGEYAVVAGKLDPHVTIYSFAKIEEAIAQGKVTGNDPYGVPVLDFDAVVEAQVELGLGPLHTQFDDKGYAYTSLFLDSAIARWSLGGPYADKHPEEPWTLVTKTPVHYNIGHLTAAEGDTVSPDGRYLMALDKWSVDRFMTVGPLHPQNFQLLDIAEGGTAMPLIYDMPVPDAEPHYAQTIKADKLAPWEIYPEIGWDPMTQAVDPDAPKPGEERIERNGNTVEIWMTVVRSHFNPEDVEIQKGDQVIWDVTSIELGKDAAHGFAISGYNINLSLEPGETETVEFDAVQDGVFTFYCSEFCSALHVEMLGYLLVQP